MHGGIALALEIHVIFFKTEATCIGKLMVHLNWVTYALLYSFFSHRNTSVMKVEVLYIGTLLCLFISLEGKVGL